MKHRILSVLLAAALLTACLAAGVSAATVSFSDVRSTDWYEKYVTPLAEAGVINGFPDGTFRPNDTVTAGQALKMILLAAGYSAPAQSGTHWAGGYLSLALSEKLIANGEIRDLDASISRLLVAKIAAKAMKLTRSGTEVKFTDTNDDNVLALNELGIIDGYPDGTFRPANFLTRAELSAIVYRILQANGGEQKPAGQTGPSNGSGTGSGTGTGGETDINTGETTGGDENGEGGYTIVHDNDEEPIWGHLNG